MNKNKARNYVIALCFAAFGSSLADPPRRALDVPNPITSISGQEMDLQGIPSFDEYVNMLPNVAQQSGVQPTEGTVDLRGLGPSHTLVLLNGRRYSSPSNADGVVFAPGQTNIIPSDLIERVEVLQDGAAAIYGSDAVAGVVNYVTRNDDIIDYKLSWTLPTTLRILNNYEYALQNNQECNATNGVKNPLWPYQTKHNFGLPEFDDGGHKLFYGSIDSGFPPGGISELVPREMIQFPHFDDVTGARHTYTRYNTLLNDVATDPTISQQDKDYFYLFMGMAIGLAGKDSVSDTAYALGQFDPEKWLQDLRASTANRAVAPADSSGSSTPVEPPVIESEPLSPDVEVSIAPFDRFPYPPDYSFDFTQCTTEQKDKVLELIGQRDSARATMLYYMDYLRREGQTTEEAADDAQRVKNAKDLRDQKNQELKEFWISCQVTGNSIQSADTQTATGNTQATTSQQSGDASAPAAAEAQPGAAASAADATSAATQQPANRPRTSCDFDADYLHNWNLEVYVTERYKMPDGSTGSRRAADVGIDITPRQTGFDLGPPLVRDRVFIDYNYFGEARKRTFTDSRGRACFPLEDVSPGFFLTPEVVDFVQNTNIDGPARDGRRVLGSPDALDERLDSLGISAGYKYRFDNDLTPKGRDWQIGADIGLRGNYNPVFGVKLEWSPVDDVIVEFPGYGGLGNTFTNLPEATRNAIPDDWKYRMGAGLSVGRSLWIPFTYDEADNVDPGFLNDVPGQGGWSNNQCGEKAFPPQGEGYLTKEQTPVKTLDDQWALERANVPDNESLFIQYADPVVIGIIDTGLDWHHPDISWDNLWRNEDEIPENGIDDDNNGYIDDIVGWDFMGNHNAPMDNDGHGTFVAGVIAATRNNDIGIDGINPNARIMVLKALNNFGRTRASYIAQAIVYGADNGARILNLSITGPGFPKIVQDAVDYAESKGVLVVVAAGNRAEDIDRATPQPLIGVMTVAATGPDDKRTVFSNVGNAISIAAPGQDVVSLRARQTDFMYNSAETTYVPGDAYIGDDAAYYRATGTSFATPIVSGAASLIFSSQPNLNHRQVRRMLEQSARDIETPGRDRFTGYGIVDAQAALGSNPEFYIYAEVPAARRLDAGDQAYLQVFGVADANQFAKANLEIGQGENPDSWTAIGADITAPVRLGELGRIPAEQLSGAETWTVRLVVQHQGGQSREARYVIDLE